jgi:predicted PurR-regulated permease PerM
MQFTSTQKMAFAWLAMAFFSAMLLWALAPVLAPFVVATVLAYALAPLVEWLVRRHVPRLLAVLVVELVCVLLVLGVLLLVVPILARELPLMRDQLPVLLERAATRLQPLLAQYGVHTALDMESIRAFIRNYLDANAGDALGSVLASLRLGGSVAFALIGNAVLIPVVLFYLLAEWHPLLMRLQALVPPRLRAGTLGFLDEADQVLGQYLRGQLLVMITLAVYYSTGLALFGLDLALPVGVFTGLLVCVPYLGFGLGLLLSTLAGLLQFSASEGMGHAFLMVGVVFGLGQLLESFFLTPKLVGERIGLHPLAVIFALLAFGQLLGFVGVLVALPASAVLLVAIRRLRSRYLASRLFTG